MLGNGDRKKVISDLLEPGGQRSLTRKRRRERRCRRWGTGWGRRLPSAGPSSPVRRSRTCSCRAASPIFAPFAWSSPPTCCPPRQSHSGLMLIWQWSEDSLFETSDQSVRRTLLWRERKELLSGDVKYFWPRCIICFFPFPLAVT